MYDKTFEEFVSELNENEEKLKNIPPHILVNK